MAGAAKPLPSPSKDATWLYHEKQVAALCAQHCLNNLVQFPAFDVGELHDYARELDERERRLMIAEGDDTPHALRFLAEDSFNVDSAGNFSQGVLAEALKRKYKSLWLDESPATIATVMKTPTQFPAFILNSSSHWYCIRRVGGRYWNLNSFLDKPQFLSDFYLAAFLA